MPSWLGKLAGSLVHLHMGWNKLSGPIDIVRELKNLEYLVLAGNANLNGTVGPVAGLTKLTHLELGSCGFGGPIDAVKGLSELTLLGRAGGQHAALR